MHHEVVNILTEALGTEKVLTGTAVKERYYHIWYMDQPLQAKAVLLPRTTEDVSIAMRICNDHEQPIVVHGGLTNLVGSTETNKNEVVISMEKMNLIEEIDEKSRTITVQAGAILEHVQDVAREDDLLFPLNYGAKGSAQIGGAISTNAGGLRVFRFGMMRNLVLGLEAVLADGTVISSMKKIIKDNSAYDLKQLFIGSEGTLGIVTKAVLKLVEASQSRHSAFVALESYNKVVDFLKHMDRGSSGSLSAYELIWKEAYEAMTAPGIGAKRPISEDYPYFVLLETLGTHHENDRRNLEELLVKALEEEMIGDAVLADSQSDMDWFWRMREDAQVIVKQCQNTQYFDISLPIVDIGPSIGEMIDQLYEMPEVEKVIAFGHVADGNIHLVISKTEESNDLIDRINQVVYGPLLELGGSISAEHGIGTHKKPYLKLCRTQEEIELMRTLKKALDPKNLLNRGKVL